MDFMRFANVNHSSEIIGTSTRSSNMKMLPKQKDSPVGIGLLSSLLDGNCRCHREGENRPSTHCYATTKDSPW